MKIVLFLFLAFAALQVGAQNIIKEDTKTEQSGGAPVMTFESMVVDYGTIEQDADPLRILKFTNTGDAPLIISNARGSCGCTVPTWPKKPIMPGETGELEIRYATNRIGQFSKTVTLSTNEPNVEHVIKVQGIVNEHTTEQSVPAGSGIAPNGGN